MLKQLKALQQSTQLAEIKASYPLANTFISVLAVVMFWRGAWGLLDTYFFPNSPTFSYVVSALLGVVVLYINDVHINNLKP